MMTPVKPVGAAIEVLEVRRVEGGGNVRAFLALRIGGITIRDAKIVQQPGRRPWLAMPDRQWTGADGKVHYVALVELSSSFKQRVTDAALAAWRAADGDGAA